MSLLGTEAGAGVVVGPEEAEGDTDIVVFH